MAGQILFTYIPGVGRVPAIGCTTAPFTLGNIAIVDAVNGNNGTASVGGTPFKTIPAALSAVSSGQGIWILPGTYTLTSGLVVPNGVSITGHSLQTTVITANVVPAAGSTTVLLTMGDSCRVENLTLNLTASSGSQILGATLVGVLFPQGASTGTSQTAKLRTCVVTVNNTGMTDRTSTTNVYGVQFSGTGALSSSTFSFNSIKASTINVIGNGAGKIRGILISNSNQASTRDVNVYVAAPSNLASTGTYVGVETNDTIGPGIGSIQLRSTTVGTVFPAAGSSYTASDILQTLPSTIIYPTYLATAGIQIGPGVDLVTKNAGGLGFSSFVYPTIVYYGLKGTITNAGAGYCWPGTQAISAGTFPDPGLPAAYYDMQQPAILCGMSASLNNIPSGTGTSVTATVYYTPTVTTASTAALYTGAISGTTLTVSGVTYGSVAVGQSVLGYGVTINTYIVSGSGSTWTVYPSQTISSTSITGGSPVASFTGSFSSTTLTVTSAVPATLAIGQYINGTGIAAGTYITAGSGTTWTLSATTVGSGLALTTIGPIPAGNSATGNYFSITFGSNDISKKFYNASQRLNNGDRVHLYISYAAGSGNLAHDLTTQLDFF